MIAQQDSIYVAEDTLITSKLLNDASDTRTLSKSSSLQRKDEFAYPRNFRKVGTSHRQINKNVWH